MSEDQVVPQETAQETAVDVAVVEDKLHDSVPVRFRFNKVTDEKTKEEFQRPAIELSLKVPSLEGIAAILRSGDEKQQALLLEAVRDVVASAAKDQINSNEKLTAETFDHAKVTWEAIANTPNERRGRGIAKEAWEAFYADYIAVFKKVLTDGEKIGDANVAVWKSRVQTLRGKLPQLQRMQDRLTLYVEHTEKGEEFTEQIKYLSDKIEEFLKEGENYGLERL